MIRRLLCTATLLALPALTGARAETLAVEVEEAPTAMAIDIEAVELAAEPETAWPRLMLRLRNSSDVAVAGWAFEIEAAGEKVDGYGDLLVLQPAPPGEAVTIELHRLEPPPRPFALRVTVVEAWIAEEVPAPSADDTAEWRLLAPLSGAPVSKEITVK